MSANRAIRHRQIEATVIRSFPLGAKIAIALFLLAAAFVLPSLLLVAVGMLPTLGAYLTDRTREKYAALAVGGLNYCGVLPILVDLWSAGHSLDVVAAKLGDPQAWLIMYGAAGLGWALVAATPGVVAFYVETRTRARIERIRAMQRELIDEWGPGVAGALDRRSDPEA